eukprot:gene7041-biopygen4315
MAFSNHDLGVVVPLADLQHVRRRRQWAQGRGGRGKASRVLAGPPHRKLRGVRHSLQDCAKLRVGLPAHRRGTRSVVSALCRERKQPGEQFHQRGFVEALVLAVEVPPTGVPEAYGREISIAPSEPSNGRSS